jgi:hypothetical protein
MASAWLAAINATVDPDITDRGIRMRGSDPNTSMRWSNPATTTGGTHQVGEGQRLAAAANVVAGADRHRKAPKERQEYLARLDSPPHTEFQQRGRRVPPNANQHSRDTRQAATRREESRRGRSGRLEPAVNIFEDISRQASTYDLGGGRAHGARWNQGGQFGHLAGHADLGSDNHYGRLGERSVKQCVVDGYNDEGCSGSAGKAGFDEGLLSFSLSNLLYIENPDIYKKCQ